MKHIRKFSQFFEKENKEDVEKIDEGIKDQLQNLLKKGTQLAKEVWNVAKRETRETREALRLIGELTQGNDISDDQKAFLQAQAVDLAKIIPLIAIQGIPAPIPITPFLIILGKKVGFDILPNSHTKVNYPV